MLTFENDEYMIQSKFQIMAQYSSSSSSHLFAESKQYQVKLQADSRAGQWGNIRVALITVRKN